MDTAIRIPDTLEQCRCHYVPPIQQYITCRGFGNCDGMDGGCWYCMELTPYQWHMCSDEKWIRGLLSPFARISVKTREEAVDFIEKYKQRNPLGNERRSLHDD